MIESIVSTLAATAIAAVVLVAYRHPRSFSELYRPVKRLLGAGALVTLGLLFGDGEARSSLQAAIQHMEPGQEALKKSLLPLVAGNPVYIWILGGIAGVYVFLETLAAFPRVGIVARDDASVAKEQPVAESHNESQRTDRRKSKSAA